MNAPRVQSFPPIAAEGSEILILGSMPGARSLALGQYYGHPQNRFWRIMALLCGYPAVPADYAARQQMLLHNQVALWDVLASCEREGSLDAAIGAEQPNDLAAFLRQHPRVRAIGCNGAKAAASLRKYQPQLTDISVTALPSTSPANARYQAAALEQAWRAWWQAVRGAKKL